MINLKSISVALLCCAFAAVGCSGHEKEVNNPTSSASKSSPASEVLPIDKRGNTAGTDGAQDAPVHAESDIDRYWLKQAAKACHNGEFKRFFEAFVRSAGVRNTYTRDQITIITNGVHQQYPKNRYFDFPIGIQDYKYISKNSETAWPNVEHLWLTFDQGQRDKFRIDWVRVRYADIGHDSASEPEITGTYGLPGYLIFETSGGCWQLAEDGVYDGPFKGALRN